MRISYILHNLFSTLYINFIIYSVSKIVRLVLQFAAQNCFRCYSKLNMGSKFLAKVAIHFPHIKSRTLIATQLLQVATQFTI